MNISLGYLEAALEFSIIDSVVVQGSPELLAAIKNKYPRIHCAENPDGNNQYDLVVAAAEESISISLETSAKAAKHTLIVTGNNNINLPENLGLKFWPEISGKGLSVFKRIKFAPTLSRYFIQQINTDDVGHKISYLKDNLYKRNFQKAFKTLIEAVENLSRERKGGVVVRISDGDYFFLRKVAVGSAKPGKRALTKPYSQIDTELFKKLLWENEIITLSIESQMHGRWKKFLFYDSIDGGLWKVMSENFFKYFQHGLDMLFGPLFASSFWAGMSANRAARRRGTAYLQKARAIINKDYLPMDAVYALVSTKWVFKNFPDSIGIIAGGPKMEIIKNLIKHTQYQQYLGCNDFTDYIEVPQKGAADDITGLAEKLGPQLKQSRAKIFLVGIGSAKVGLLPLLKKYTSAVFIDVGAGLDALAGIVSQDRPYFADWVNYRMKNYDYSAVDFMDQGNPARDSQKYGTVYL